jgi:hypothetical protein
LNQQKKGEFAMTEQEIANRLNRLEKSNRRWRFAAVGLLVGMTGMYFLGAEPRMKELTVEKIRLVDEDGKLRGALGSDDRGSFFYLNDQKGGRRVNLAAHKNGGFINLKDDADKSRVVLSWDEDGAAIKTMDTHGLFSRLITDEHGPALQVGQEDGMIRVLATMVDVIQEPQKPERPNNRTDRPEK